MNQSELEKKFNQLLPIAQKEFNEKGFIDIDFFQLVKPYITIDENTLYSISIYYSYPLNSLCVTLWTVEEFNGFINYENSLDCTLKNAFKLLRELENIIKSDKKGA